MAGPSAGPLRLSEASEAGLAKGETEVEILRANYSFRAIPISQGEHLVTFSYEPESFRQGLAISTVALGVLVGLGVYLRLQRQLKVQSAK